MNYITLEHINSLKRFNAWMKEEVQNKAIFSVNHHVIEKDNHITIDKGRMVLQFKETGINLVDVSMGSKMIVAKSQENLDQILMHGLQWAVKRHFINTYNGLAEIG